MERAVLALPLVLLVQLRLALEDLRLLLHRTVFLRPLIEVLLIIVAFLPTTVECELAPVFVVLRLR